MDSSVRATVVAFHENASTNAAHTTVPALASVQIPQTLPSKEVVSLCQTMRDAIPFAADRNSVVCFTGSGNNDIIANVALEAASAAASQINLRVLLIDAVANPKDASRKALLGALRTTLYGTLRNDLPYTDALTTVRNSNLFYTCLSQENQGDMAVSVLGSLRKLIDELRASYDLIIINGGSVMGSALSLELARMSDGAVMVVEAERTRTPVARRAKAMIENSGGRVIGAVLGNRRYHIPEFLYKWI